MAIFFTKNETAEKISPLKVGLEKDIQKLFEKNLDEILNIVFLATEYSTSFGGRIDSLGIDKNGSPVIIEYKKGQNDNVINQGLSYLRWLLDHKAEFEALVSGRDDFVVEVDWTSPRVICVAESYNKFDLDTADLLPMNIELLKYQLYENDILLVEQETQRKVKISTSEIFDRKEKQKREFKDIHYTLDFHLKSAGPKIQEIFSTLKEKISALDESIIEEAKAKYIAYKLTTNFCDVVVQHDALKIFLNIPSGALDNPEGLARDLTKPKFIGHWGNGDYEVKIERVEDVDKVMELIKQSYMYNK
jgi:predicted transport protein